MAELDQELRADVGVGTYTEYRALEERLFQQLDDLVYATVPPEKQNEVNRCNRGSLSEPERWLQDWNHSFELPAASPQAGVLLLHGMSDPGEGSAIQAHHSGYGGNDTVGRTLRASTREARWVGTWGRDARTLLSRRRLQVIGEGNAQEWDGSDIGLDQRGQLADAQCPVIEEK